MGLLLSFIVEGLKASLNNLSAYVGYPLKLNIDAALIFITLR